MKATFFKSYSCKKTGDMIFVYTLDGSDKEIAAYRSIQGNRYKEVSDKPLYFTNLPMGKSCWVTISNGKLYHELEDLSMRMAISRLVATITMN